MAFSTFAQFRKGRAKSSAYASLVDNVVGISLILKRQGARSDR